MLTPGAAPGFFVVTVMDPTIIRCFSLPPCREFGSVSRQVIYTRGPVLGRRSEVGQEL